MKKFALNVAAGFAFAAFSAAAVAGAPADQIARLGNDLTPVGAEKAGNEAGTIPAWTPAQQRGPLSGEYPADPKIDGESPLFTITAANMAEHADKLTEGHKELLRRFPDSYKLNVYPSHRVVTWPDEIFAATKKNAETCTLVDRDNINDCELGFPFPIPQSGAEPIWNHRLKWRGENARRFNNQMIVQQNGSYQLTKLVEDVTFGYASIKRPRRIRDGSAEFLRYLSETLAPPRLAGTFILVHESSGTGAEGRNAWLYSPGLRRIRRAPTVCCDNPYEGTDGHQFYDQVDMYNGVLERFTWKLVGKREMYIPYNSNKIAGPSVKYADLASPRHLNQDLPRYELHRVWVVEAENRPDLRHTFKKRVFYIDEDSWTIVAVDAYDHRDQLFQFQEGHLVFAYNVLAATTIPEVIYHFNSGRYFITAMINEDSPYDLTVSYDDSFFTAAAVQRRTAR
jgi:hypothetical protein